MCVSLCVWESVCCVHALPEVQDYFGSFFWSVCVCVSGSDVVDWLFHHVEGFADRREARKFASNLLKAGFIRHTVNKITFSEQCYYVFGDLSGSECFSMIPSAAGAGHVTSCSVSFAVCVDGMIVMGFVCVCDCRHGALIPAGTRRFERSVWSGHARASAPPGWGSMAQFPIPVSTLAPRLTPPSCRAGGQSSQWGWGHHHHHHQSS